MKMRGATGARPASRHIGYFEVLEAVEKPGCPVCRLAVRTAELGEYIRKHDYRFAHEPWGSEADAPRRAVACIAGARGVVDG